MEQIRVDHGMAQAKAEDVAFSRARLSYGVSFRQGHRTGWWAGVEHVLTLQSGMDALAASDALAELRKGPGSIYWPLLEADPRFWVDCPRCDARQVIDAGGLCPVCAHDFGGGS